VNVSLILTVLNEEGSIGSLLESVSAQSRLPDEVVVCDAGSTDRTLQVLEEWQRVSGLVVKILVRPGINIAGGRNAAIQEAVHDVIAVTDGGCVLDYRWLERMCAHLAGDGNREVVYGGSVARGRRMAGRAFADLYNTKTNGTTLTNTEHSSRSVAFTKSAWAKVGGYPEGLTLAGEDTAFFAELDKSHRTTIARDALVHWFHGTNTLRTIYRVHLRNSIGEAEAGLWPVRHAALVLGYATCLTLIIWPGSRASRRGAGALALAAIACRHNLKVLRYTNNPATLALLPLVTVARDLGMIHGHTIGLLRGTKGRYSALDHDGMPFDVALQFVLFARQAGTSLGYANGLWSGHDTKSHRLEQ